MRTIDLSPLYRSFIGSDRLATFIDNAARFENQSTFPPYNIELLEENKYRIAMAVAGFSDNEIQIEVQENTLTVSGKKEAKEEKDDRRFLHKGISERNFERKFQLGDHVNVIGAALKDGLLNIDLERIIPESKKPKRIEIGKPALENKAE
ncbi:Hsp20 family protein [Alteromonas sp. 14N.309.X.WAT.G.H12]|uniref:Hsp20 family protein n=1 Tax=Alteromonas sp. 14N.309.X.WAT.G.H12 TaxID=3120824 RepID=UPI002FD6FC80